MRMMIAGVMQSAASRRTSILFAVLLTWYMGWGLLNASLLGPLQAESVVFFVVLGVALGRSVGRDDDAARYRHSAEDAAAAWTRDARDGDHYALTFGGEGTWSQKYNLVWDRLLGLGLFGADVARSELAHYRAAMQTYGLPLDSRKTYTKLDWIFWSATLTGSREDFDALAAPVYRWLDETPSRVPLTDWYETTDGRKVGFQARSVVGGVFIARLADEGVWKKWRGRAAAGLVE